MEDSQRDFQQNLLLPLLSPTGKWVLNGVTGLDSKVCGSIAGSELVRPQAIFQCMPGADTDCIFDPIPHTAERGVPLTNCNMMHCTLILCQQSLTDIYAGAGKGLCARVHVLVKKKTQKSLTFLYKERLYKGRCIACVTVALGLSFFRNALEDQWAIPPRPSAWLLKWESHWRGRVREYDGLTFLADCIIISLSFWLSGSWPMRLAESVQVHTERCHQKQGQPDMGAALYQFH